MATARDVAADGRGRHAPDVEDTGAGEGIGMEIVIGAEVPRLEGEAVGSAVEGVGDAVGAAVLGWRFLDSNLSSSSKGSLRSISSRSRRSISSQVFELKA